MSCDCQSALCTVLYLYFRTAFAFKKNACETCLIAYVCPSRGSFGGSFGSLGPRWGALWFVLGSFGFVLVSRSQVFERGIIRYPIFGGKSPTSLGLGVNFDSTSSNFKLCTRIVRYQYCIPKLACTHVGSICSATVATLVLSSPCPGVANCQSCMENAACRLCYKALTAKHDAILFYLEQRLLAYSDDAMA